METKQNETNDGPTILASDNFNSKSIQLGAAYVDSQCGFTINPPAGWIDQIFTNCLQFCGPWHENTRPIINIYVDGVPKGYDFPRMCQELLIPSLENSMRTDLECDGNLVPEKISEINGFHAREYSSYFQSSSVDLKGKLVCILIGERVFSFWLNARADIFDFYVPVFEASIRTLALQKQKKGFGFIIKNLAKATAKGAFQGAKAGMNVAMNSM